MTDLLAIVLAAGEGTRMNSSRPKVLHEIGGLGMVGHVVRTAQLAGATRLAVVVGPGHDAVSKSVSALAAEAVVVTQTERLGTGHAVWQARAALENYSGNVIVMLGDAPLVRSSSIAAAVARLDAGADIAVVGFEAAIPTGYGRLITEGNLLRAIREEKDASDEQRAITLCNSGIIAFKAETLVSVIDRIENRNAKGEFYLTDAIELANADGRNVSYTVAPEAETQGVNDRSQLAKAEAQFQAFRREEFMKAGVTLRDPATTYFSYDTEIGRDVVIEPSVWFGPGVTVGDGAIIHAFSHIEGASIGAGSHIGPFARLRPGADLAEDAKVGNFVEVKNARVGKGAKLNHLTYVGDADVGERANLGAGTITCNYDGVNKHRTVIGADAFIGSNSSLVAPVSIGDGAYVASGSVITKDVAAGDLAFGRARQESKAGRARIIRERALALKAQKAGKKEH